MKKAKWTLIYRFLFIVLLLICHQVLNMEEALASSSIDQVNSLQAIIDQLDAGDAIELPPGTYAGPATINKKVYIRGNSEVTLLNPSGAPAISILSDGVHLANIQIKNNASGDQSPAILVKSHQVTLEDLTIQTSGYGIILRDADQAILQNNTITWFKPETNKPKQKGNGIDLYNSNGTLIKNNRITGVRDAIYLEKSRNARIQGNKLSRTRYGIHCMYIDGSSVIDNEGQYNITGAMVMGVKNVVVSGNVFRRQSQNVHSQGILLYDVQSSSINKNVVEGNRVGIYMEQSSENELSNNAVLRNFIGIQLINSNSNQFHGNEFIANVIEAEAADSQKNEMIGNYWDSFQGLDLNHDGTSEIPYAINPFYQLLVTQTPAYQLFFQSPGMTFLSDMFTNGQEGWSIDSSPLMNADFSQRVSTESAKGSADVLAIGLLLLCIAIYTIIFLGVMRE
ncbi:nitrous oxide reductase family maturation protein NosD [Paenibacillus sp. GCM10027629]|uniref:right-handed parallel beta-helix repeat-containing protein n=1 Tax=Paenibacillus sp. GCM10027629 TaxID=3273414 RepID=UPI003641F843